MPFFSGLLFVCFSSFESELRLSSFTGSIAITTSGSTTTLGYWGAIKIGSEVEVVVGGSDSMTSIPVGAGAVWVVSVVVWLAESSVVVTEASVDVWVVVGSEVVDSGVG